MLAKSAAMQCSPCQSVSPGLCNARMPGHAGTPVEVNSGGGAGRRPLYDVGIYVR